MISFSFFHSAFSVGRSGKAIMIGQTRYVWNENFDHSNQFFCFHCKTKTKKCLSLPVKDYKSSPPVFVDAVTEGKHFIHAIHVFDTDAKKAVEEAYALAERFGHAEVTTLHLFMSCLVADRIRIVFARLGVNIDGLEKSFLTKLKELPKGNTPIFSVDIEEVLLSVCGTAYEQGNQYVSVLELGEESYRRNVFIQDWFESKEVNHSRFHNAVAWVRIQGKLRERYERFRHAAARKPVGAMNRSMTAVVTPFLDQVTEDLTTHAVYGRLPLLIGREKEMDEMFRLWEGRNTGILLVGANGVGKETLLAGIAERMVEEQVPALLGDKRFVMLSIPALLSGVSFSEAQERLVTVLAEAVQAGNVVLAISHIEQLADFSAEGEGADLTALLADVARRGILLMVATTTPEAYFSRIESSSLSQSFQKVILNEPDQDTSIQILESKSASIENEHGVLFSFDALEKAVALSDRYLHETHLPQKAIELLKEAAVTGRNTKGVNTFVTGEDVARILARKTGIPLTRSMKI